MKHLCKNINPKFMTCYDILVSGRVQGVGFRYSTKNKAIELGIQGYVENKEDGTVHIVAMATASKMRLFLEWCHSGPSSARVDKLDYRNVGVESFDGFEIRR